MARRSRSAAEDGEEQAFYFCQVGFANGHQAGVPGAERHTGQRLPRPASSTGTGPGPTTSPSRSPTSRPPWPTPSRCRVPAWSTPTSSKPNWKEAFLHPKQSHGIVIQLAQQGDGEGWPDPAPTAPVASRATVDDGRSGDPPRGRSRRRGRAVRRRARHGEGLGRHRRAARPPASRSVSGTLGATPGGSRPHRGPRQTGSAIRSGRVLQLEMTVADPSVIDDVRRDRVVLVPGAGARNLGTPGS